jgi:hypothetical protein
MAEAMIMTIFAQKAGHQTIASTRMAAASKKRQKQNFMAITSLNSTFWNYIKSDNPFKGKDHPYRSGIFSTSASM